MVLIFGLSLSAFTTLHVTISLIAMLLGVVVLLAMLRGQRAAGLTAAFLATPILTSVTGFMLPSVGATPAQIVGAISLAVLAAAVIALYVFQLRGAWRPVYVASAALALYLNFFVGVVQAFQKLAPLNQLAPTQSEPPFVVAQLVVLGLFATAGLLALRRFRPIAA